MLAPSIDPLWRQAQTFAETLIYFLDSWLRCAHHRSRMANYQDVKRAAREHGINVKTLWNRMKRGLSLEDAIKYKPGGPYAGVTKMSRATGIPASTLISRINNGKTLVEAIQMGHPRAQPNIKEDTMRRRAERGDSAPLRPVAVRQTGVVAVAEKTGLSKQRVSELMGAGVAPDQIERMRAKQETPREKRERIDAANKKDWTEMATKQRRSADLSWVESFLCLIAGWFRNAATHADQARSYENTATWWADKAIGQWCEVCEKKHPPPMHRRGDQRT